MSDFDITFTRYRKDIAERRISAPIRVIAEKFDDAHTRARDMLRGMSEADPESLFDLVSIGAQGFRGTVCEMGGRMWETREEFFARTTANAGNRS